MSNLVDHRKSSLRNFQKQLFNYYCFVSTKTLILQLTNNVISQLSVLSYDKSSTLSSFFIIENVFIRDFFPGLSLFLSCFLLLTIYFLFNSFACLLPVQLLTGMEYFHSWKSLVTPSDQFVHHILRIVGKLKVQYPVHKIRHWIVW